MSDIEHKNGESGQYLILNIDAHYFAVSVKNIQDVIRENKKTPVPLSKDNINGVLNLRGHIVTEIDVAQSLGLSKATDRGAGDGFAVVVNVDGEAYSFRFGGVGDVIEIETDQIDPLPETLQKSWHRVAVGVYRMPEHLVVLLDLDMLIAQIKSSCRSVVNAVN
ncbi:MAG: chemotaxis protein CheW [Alphaproteobacteria bacterium]|jgi:purine-binding chemotaxis protein CheW|nr:chemotaxis protein CheW [Alphaproteobacteria bacterium]MDP7223413.1 chemotaxis protein CheW [Alphaproteobacteria bacterium]